MTHSRRYFDHSMRDSNRGPSDEMLAVDAASEVRSLTLLYERYGDRLYRYFLVCTGDVPTSERLLRTLISQLPDQLQRYASTERSFAGWLFGNASRILWREHSFVNRLQRRIAIYVPTSLASRIAPQATTEPEQQRTGDEWDLIRQLQEIGPGEREVIALNLAAGLATLPASEALRMPASLLSSHVEHALGALAQRIGTNNLKRLAEDVRATTGRLQLDREQRRGHISLIHGLFFGEEQAHVEDEDERRGPALLEIGALALVVVIGLFGIWVWGQLTTGDTAEHDVPVTMVQSDDDESPASAPEETPTPEPEATPTPEEMAATAPDDSPEVCLAADGKAKFDQFILRFNQGNFEALEEMLPRPSYDHPLLDGDQESDPVPHQIFLHDDVGLEDPEEIIAFLTERYEAGERWDVLEAYPAEHYRNWHGAAPLEMYQDWKRENPEFGLIIVAAMDWSGSESSDDIASGRVIVDCAQELIVDWDMRPDRSQASDPVSIDDFVLAMETPEPGESRQIRARVGTDRRDDGGALTNWELTWEFARNSAGDSMNRIEVRQLDGGQIISYVSDGHRWRLDQRGWRLYGGSDEDPPFPEEISLPIPWLSELPYMLAEQGDSIQSNGSGTLTRDLSYTADVATERWLELDYDAGNIVSARLREVGSNGERVTPTIQLLSVARSTGFDPSDFNVALEPRFPEKETDAARYRVPDSEWPELTLISMRVGNDQAREEYRLSWNGVEFDLRVRPSRGGLDPASIPEGVDESWSTAAAQYSYGTLVWAHRQFAGYPTDAIWDNGLYRFELSIDRDLIDPDDDWSLGRLIELADALSEHVDEEVFARDRERDRESVVRPSFIAFSD